MEEAQALADEVLENLNNEVHACPKQNADFQPEVVPAVHGGPAKQVRFYMPTGKCEPISGHFSKFANDLSRCISFRVKKSSTAASLTRYNWYVRMTSSNMAFK